MHEKCSSSEAEESEEMNREVAGKEKHHGPALAKIDFLEKSQTPAPH